MEEIKIVLTMDCEPTTATSHPTATGPETWDKGEDAVLGYSQVASQYGLPVTFFVHPETAISQAHMFRERAAAGDCLGLHMHPWKYSLWRHAGKRYFAHYGGLPPSEQRALLGESSALWREAIGYQPRYFRPGTFSANDAVFQILAESGFRGGSCSAPGRVIPEMQAIWVGAQLDPHRASVTFRQSAGDLEFGNMPLSADTSRVLSGPSGRNMFADFRPDVDWPGQYGVGYRTIATNIVTQVKQRNPNVPVLNAITHNHYAYRNSSDQVYCRLRVMLDEMMAACHAAKLKVVGATVERVVDDVLASPPVEERFFAEGAIFDRGSRCNA